MLNPAIIDVRLHGSCYCDRHGELVIDSLTRTVQTDLTNAPSVRATQNDQDKTSCDATGSCKARHEDSIYPPPPARPRTPCLSASPCTSRAAARTLRPKASVGGGRQSRPTTRSSASSSRRPTTKMYPTTRSTTAAQYTIRASGCSFFEQSRSFCTARNKNLKKHFLVFSPNLRKVCWSWRVHAQSVFCAVVHLHVFAAACVGGPLFCILHFLHRCRKYNTYRLLTAISKSNCLYFRDSIVQKYAVDPETHKMTIFLAV